MRGIRKDYLGELEKLKKQVIEKFPSIDVRNFHILLSRLGTFHYKKEGLLLGAERQLYDFLIEHSYNPYTAYRWALLERVPEEIRFQIKNYYISQKKATKIFFERRHETDSALQVDVKEMGLRLIREM